MKKLLMVGMVTALVTAAAGAAELKIATVDLDKVFTAHPRTRLAEAELKKAETSIQEEMDRIVAEGKGLEEEVDKLRSAAKNPMLTDEARLKKSNEAEEKLTDLQEFQVRARRTQETNLKQMREQVMKSRQSIVDDLMTAVSDFAKEKGYDLVLDRSGMTANLIPLVAYSSPALDVTEPLIEKLKASAGSAE